MPGNSLERILEELPISIAETFPEAILDRILQKSLKKTRKNLKWNLGGITEEISRKIAE